VTQRDPIILSQVVPRFLTVAITVVLGFQFGPQLFVGRPSTPVVCCADQNGSEHSFKVGERREPRVLRSPFLDRLPPVRPSCRPGAVRASDEAVALGVSVSDGPSDYERLPIVKHVPRMERGDPPRT
jgi:hypothetical protein